MRRILAGRWRADVVVMESLDAEGSTGMLMVDE